MKLGQRKALLVHKRRIAVCWVPPHQEQGCHKPVSFVASLSFALFSLRGEGEKGFENGQSMLGQLLLPGSWIE